MNLNPMNPNTPETDENEVESSIDELTLLKQRAALMGISHSPNIGIETLRSKIKSVSEEKDEETAQLQSGETAEVASTSPFVSTRVRIRNEALKLIRIRLTNMNPNKAAIPGDIFAVSNKFIGEVRKVIPYDPKFYENGFHVPQCILDQLKEKQFMTSRVVKDPSVPSGERTETMLVKEFAIEILDPLTPEELQKLAADQRSRNAIG